MGMVSTGLKRRARLLSEALRPPSAGALVRQRGAAGPRPATAATAAVQPKPRRPERKTAAMTYTAPPAPRLVESPVFVLAPVRSGSTLLRMLLNSHSRIRAPHELHLRAIDVHLTPGYSDVSMREIDLDKAELEHVLWDRILSLELQRSGKDVIADKTPGNVFAWQRLHHAWPKARFLILLRHPRGIVASLFHRQSNTSTWRQLERTALTYLETLEKARQELDCLTIRYEKLTEEPEKVTRLICEYLGVEWERGMLDYGSQDHGPFARNLGDRSVKIKSGRVQAARPLTDGEELSAPLAEIASSWGYD